MAINEQHRQLEVARELEAAVRTLAQPTRTAPSPADSYELLGDPRDHPHHHYGPAA